MILSNIDSLVITVKKKSPNNTSFIEKWSYLSTLTKKVLFTMAKLDKENTALTSRNFTLEEIYIEQMNKIKELEAINKKIIDENLTL